MYREDTRELLQAAGFVDIAEQVIQAPLLAWTVDPLHCHIAAFHQVSMDSCFGLEALSLALFTRLWAWDLASIKGLIDGVRRELQTKAIHKYNNMYVNMSLKLCASVADEITDMCGLLEDQPTDKGRLCLTKLVQRTV